ncbi:hypothetical protein NE466_08845 [Veillonella parvula]|uniref:relaxase/mobilization nuclease domain-containing protein n=1 Tax=Veillonella parvula TaxID=29466 RepID=UPI001D08D98A|nr:hypothetical protein [Veillonella parvula]MCB6805930.1 hypothetical protein [Veillonella parvula]MCQ4927649.1 hypothetical protein [Veillonella parvula]MCQ4958838.1 hypothetical protein [Veillonella parvula]
MAKLTSIFKMIGAQSARLKTPNEAIDYIFNKKKTSSDLCSEQYLDLDTPLEAWSVHPMHKTEKERLFLHAMLCPYGDRIPSTNELKEIVKGLMEVFDGYPMFSAIHTDHPSSPHIHILIHPRNIFTDKVWQQSPSDLRHQKKAISSILTNLGLYGTLPQNQCASNQGETNPRDDISFDLLETDNFFDDYSNDEGDWSNENLSLNVKHVPKVSTPISQEKPIAALMGIISTPTNQVIYDLIENGVEFADMKIVEDFNYVKKIR